MDNKPIRVEWLQLLDEIPFLRADRHPNKRERFRGGARSQPYVVRITYEGGNQVAYYRDLDGDAEYSDVWPCEAEAVTDIVQKAYRDTRHIASRHRQHQRRD